MRCVWSTKTPSPEVLKVKVAPRLHFAVAFAALALLAGCVTTVSFSEMSVVAPPPVTPRAITLEVVGPTPDPLQDGYTLLQALQRAFATRGYQLDASDLTLTATFVNATRGSAAANQFLGLGIGSDSYDVHVEVRDKEKSYMTFAVRGGVHDKRYDNLYGVAQAMAKKIVAEVEKAGR
jgi:hypothetical protein